MSWTDEELDDLFKDASQKQSFEYNSAYFKDIEAQLPVRRRKRLGFWWFGGAGALMIIVSGIIISNRQNNELTFNKISKSETDNSGNTSLINKENGTESQQAHSVNKKYDTPTQELNRLNHSAIDMSTTQVSQIEIPEIINRPEDSGYKTPSINFETTTVNVDPVNVSDNNTNGLEKGEVSELPFKNVLNLLTSEATLLESVHKPLNSRTPKSMVYAELSGGLGQSPISSSDNGSTRSFVYGIHLGYEHSWSSWSVSIGAGLSEQTFSNLYINERSFIYGFGLNTVDNQYRFSSLMRFDIPISLTRRFGSHQIIAGFNTAIPLIARLSYKEIINDELIEEGSGFTDASYFKKIIIEPTIGYRFSLNKNWSIGAQMKMQVMNPLNTDRVKGERTLLPISGQVTLKRTLGL